MPNGQEDDIEGLKKRIKTLIVTVSILALIVTVFSTLGCFAGKDFIKRTVKEEVNEYAKEEVQSMLEGYKKDIDAKLDTLNKKIDNLAEKKIKMVGKSEDELSKVLDASEKEFKILYEKGEIEFKNGKYLEAIIFFTEAKDKTVHSQNKAYSLTYRGAAYFYQDSYPEAIADFNEAIGYQIKGHALPYCNKGLILFLVHGNYEEAIENLEKAIEVNPKLRDSYEPLYNLYKRKGDDENAFRMYQLLRKFAMDDIKQLKNRTEKEKERKEIIYEE